MSPNYSSITVKTAPHLKFIIKKEKKEKQMSCNNRTGHDCPLYLDHYNIDRCQELWEILKMKQ